MIVKALFSFDSSYTSFIFNLYLNCPSTASGWLIREYTVRIYKFKKFCRICPTSFSPSSLYHLSTPLAGMSRTLISRQPRKSSWPPTLADWATCLKYLPNPRMHFTSFNFLTASRTEVSSSWSLKTGNGKLWGSKLPEVISHRVCHGFRLMKQDDYFWVDFDHF